MRFEFDEVLWRHSGEAAWFFVTLPVDVGAEIIDATDGLRRGFGSLRVRAEIGGARWETSIFPDSASGSFVLPVKKAIRQRASIDDGDRVTVVVALRDL